MSEHEGLITEFASLTGCPSERARFFLEANNWDLSTALETYFDSEEAGANVEAMDVDRDNDEPSSGLMDYIRQGVQRVTGAPSPANPSAGSSSSNETSAARPPKKSAQTSSTGARIATLGSIKGRQESEDESDDDDGRKRQEFYVGSGQEVLGSKTKKRNPDEIISSVFQSARQHGAEAVDDPAEQQQQQQSRGRSAAFGGAGVRLGATPEELQGTATNQAGTRTAAGGASASTSTAAGQQSAVVVLRMWRNGFTIDQGDLRLYTDPANQEFMEYIKQGRVPRELVSATKGKDLKVQMEDHRDKEYEKPKQPVQYFTGSGNMLGSPAPAVVTGNTPKPTVSLSEDQRKAAEEGKAKASVSINSSKPTTNLQIRLGDGSRLVQAFNETSTVGDLRRYIQAARPEYSGQSFQILAGYPSKPVTNDQQSLKEANLLNAAITVK